MGKAFALKTGAGPWSLLISLWEGLGALQHTGRAGGSLQPLFFSEYWFPSGDTFITLNFPVLDNHC